MKFLDRKSFCFCFLMTLCFFNSSLFCSEQKKHGLIQTISAKIQNIFQKLNDECSLASFNHEYISELDITESELLCREKKTICHFSHRLNAKPIIVLHMMDHLGKQSIMSTLNINKIEDLKKKLDSQNPLKYLVSLFVASRDREMLYNTDRIYTAVKKHFDFVQMHKYELVPGSIYRDDDHLKYVVSDTDSYWKFAPDCFFEHQIKLKERVAVNHVLGQVEAEMKDE